MNSRLLRITPPTGASSSDSFQPADLDFLDEIIKDIQQTKPIVLAPFESTNPVIAAHPIETTEPSFRSLSNNATHTGHVFSGSHIQRQVLKKLEELNKDPDVLYMEDLRKRPDWEKTDKLITEKALACGFIRKNEKEYIYEGNDPAMALRQLINVRPLVLDCDTVLKLLTYQALLEILDTAQFNTYIQQTCGSKEISKLAICAEKKPILPSDIRMYYTARHEKNENPLPDALESGDHLYVQGPADNLAFHVNSDFNGYNVLVKMTGSGKPQFIGLVSQDTKTHGCWTYGELCEILLKAYEAPLTLRDVYHINKHKDSDSPVTYSSCSFRSAYEWLKDNYPKDLYKALELLKSPNVDLDRSTNIFPPLSNTIRGVRSHVRAHAMLSLTKLINGNNNLSSIAINPVIPPDKTFDPWISGFDLSLPHQKMILAAINEFYGSCKQNAPSIGLILYGKAGTGKTMACQALVKRLRDEGFAVWKTDFHEGSNLLTLKEMTELLSLSKQGKNAVIDQMIMKFAPVWKAADILYIDYTNNTYDALADISNAAIRYVREANEQGKGKKILITCNSDPIKAFHSTITFPVDSIVIRHIDGPDYREQMAWYCSLSLNDYTVPETIQEKPATKNQQTMHQWLQALETHPGHNGVAFYGKPGIGKTTVLHAFFSTMQDKAYWIEAHTLHTVIDLKETLASKEAEYLVIDDCNDPKNNDYYRSVLFSLLNNETLFNKNDQPVRTIFVSNRNHWQELVHDTTYIHTDLTPRMQSRYQGRFISVMLDAAEDFRTQAPKTGVIAKPSAIDPSTYAHSLSLNEFFEKRAAIQKQIISPTSSSAKDEASNKLHEIDREILAQISNASGVAIDLTGQDKDFQYRWEVRHIMKQALDTMEVKPGFRITILSNDPAADRETIEKTMKGADATGKYVSRLERIALG